MDFAYTQIYTGDGKGKTTAALGLCVRAAGAGKKIYFAQFMKSGEYSENRTLAERFPEVTYAALGEGILIGKDGASEQDIALAKEGLETAKREMLSGKYDIVILDEICVAQYLGLLSADDVLALMDARPPQTELVLTGRRAHERLVERADLVTDMGEVKHYYSQGVMARVGIEM